MKKITTLIFLFIFIINGCVDSSSGIDEIEFRLLEILDEDAAAGLDGFDSGGDMDLEYSIGLETDGIARISSDTLSWTFGKKQNIPQNIYTNSLTLFDKKPISILIFSNQEMPFMRFYKSNLEELGHKVSTNFYNGNLSIKKYIW